MSRGADPPHRTRLAVAAQWIGLAVTIAIVFHRALTYFFSQDDFAGLARSHGLIPRLAGPWRWVSGQAFFDLMRAIAGLDPLPYHVASLASHLAAATLLLLLLRRHVGGAAAWVGAVFFAVHPALFTALYSISGIGEILALVFGLAALLAARRRGPWRWSALPLFALSLLCKESTLLLPLIALAERGRTGRGDAPSYARGPAPGGQRTAARGTGRHRGAEATPRDPMPPGVGTPDPRWRDPVLLGLALLSALYVVSFLGRDVFGVRRALGEREAYHLAFDATLLRNLLSYAGWTVNIASPLVRSVSDSIDPLVFPHAIAALIAWAAGLAVPALRRRGWAVGGLMFACLILPVLPLRNHTYHYYLYAPLAGAAWCVAAALDAALARTGVRTAARGGTAIALGALLTWNAALLVRKIETFPFLHPDLRADPIVDRARIAGNVHADLARARLPQGASLRFWSPSSIELDRAAGRDPAHESYWEQNVRNALMDGLAVRVLFPQVRSIEFVRAFPPSDNSHLYALYRLDGHLEVRRGSELDSLRRAATAPP